MENTMSDLQSVFTNNESFINFCKNYIQFDNAGNNSNISHPNNKILYQYVNNVLEVNDTNAVMNHIAYCERCAKEVSWIMKKNLQMEEKLFRMANSVSLYHQLTNYCRRTITRFHDLVSLVDYFNCFHVNRYALAFISILFLIILPSIIFIVHNPHEITSVQVELQSKLKLLVDQHFEMFINDRSKIDTDHILFPWEKKSNILLFAPTECSETDRKFVSGLYSARNILLNDSQTNDVLIELNQNISPDDSIFLLGKWCFLMKIYFLSDVDISDQFKKQTIIITDQFNNDIDQDQSISKDNIEYLQKKMNTIYQIITTWPDDKIIERRYKNQISDIFSKIIKYFSPLDA